MNIKTFDLNFVLFINFELIFRNIYKCLPFRCLFQIEKLD